MVTCFWVFATQFVADKDLNWLLGGEFNQKDTAEQYLVSLYFTITTITTVGYGDISATNSTERVFCIFIQLLGVIGFSFATGTLSSIIQNYDALDSQYQA